MQSERRQYKKRRRQRNETEWNSFQCKQATYKRKTENRNAHKVHREAAAAEGGENKMANQSEANNAVSQNKGTTFSEEFEEIITMFVQPAVVLAGLFCNILNIIVIARKRSKLSTAMVLLFWLSVTDTVVLAVQVPYVLMVYLEPYFRNLYASLAFYICYIRWVLFDFASLIFLIFLKLINIQ